MCQFIDQMFKKGKVAGSESPKIIKETDLVPKPKKEPVRIFVDGCFDLIHSGHYNAIR